MARADVPTLVGELRAIVGTVSRLPAREPVGLPFGLAGLAALVRALDSARGELPRGGSLELFEEWRRRYRADVSAGLATAVRPFFRHRQHLADLRRQPPRHAPIGNFCAVVLFQFWEDHYRAWLAQLLHLPGKRDLKSSIFGDLRLLRNAIVYDHGVASTRIEDCELLSWFRAGDVVLVDGDRLLEIRRYVESYLDELERTTPESALAGSDEPPGS